MFKKTNIDDAQAFLALARSELPRLLEEWSGQPVRDLSEGARPVPDGRYGAVDMVLEWAGSRVLVGMRSGARSAQVESAIRGLKVAAGVSTEAVLALVAVPHMGAAGARRCAAAGVSWADLSGNAEIRLGGIVIHRRGEPNRFTLGGSRPNPFSTKASRIPRALLMAPQRWWRQEDLISATDLSRGYVSQIVSALERLQLVLRDERHRVRPGDPDLLLDSWMEEYSPRAGAHVPGHVASRTGAQLADSIAGRLREEGLEYRLTSLAAAWRHGPRAMFRSVHVYVRRRPGAGCLEALGFREGVEGANVHFIVTDDEAIWCGAVEVEGAVCVSALQACLDLKGLGERSEEALQELRQKCLPWVSSD